MAATKKAPAKREGVEVEAMGVRAVVRPDALDDFDVMRKLCDVGENSARGLFVIMEAIFGDDLKRVTDELRDGDGKLPMSRVGEFMNEVTRQVNELKN